MIFRISNGFYLGNPGDNTSKFKLKFRKNGRQYHVNPDGGVFDHMGMAEQGLMPISLILQASEIFVLAQPLNATTPFPPIWAPLSTLLQTVGPSHKFQTERKFVWVI